MSLSYAEGGPILLYYCLSYRLLLSLLNKFQNVNQVLNLILKYFSMHKPLVMFELAQDALSQVNEFVE